MNTNTTALRVITLADGRRVKETKVIYGCKGCMFHEPDHPVCGCTITREISKQIGEDCKTPREGCNAGVIYQPADPEPTEVAEQVEREPLPEIVSTIIERAQRLVDHADFQLGGVLSAESKASRIPSRAASKVKARHLASLRDALRAYGISEQAAEPVKREPLTEQSIVDLIPTTGITSSREAIWFARAIERAHGIGQQDKGTDHA